VLITHALPLAITSGKEAFARYLLDQGADANGSMHGVSALHTAAGPVDMWLRAWLRVRGIDGVFGRTAAVSGAVHRYGFPVARQEDAACLSSKNGFHGTVRAAANGNRAAASVSGPH